MFSVLLRQQPLKIHFRPFAVIFRIGYLRLPSNNRRFQLRPLKNMRQLPLNQIQIDFDHILLRVLPSNHRLQVHQILPHKFEFRFEHFAQLLQRQQSCHIFAVFSCKNRHLSYPLLPLMFLLLFVSNFRVVG